MWEDFACSYNFNETNRIIIDHEFSSKSISQCNLELLWQLCLYSFLEGYGVKTIFLGIEFYSFDCIPKLCKIVGTLKFLKFYKVMRKVTSLKNFLAEIRSWYVKLKS